MKIWRRKNIIIIHLLIIGTKCKYIFSEIALQDIMNKSVQFLLFDVSWPTKDRFIVEKMYYYKIF